jgi:hypothetical protein
VEDEAIALLLVPAVAAAGLALGEIRLAGVRLGVGGVLFAGLAAGQLGFAVDETILMFVREFGLVLFVYAVGISIGPGFFAAFKRNGLTLNSMALSIVLLGALLAVAGCARNAALAVTRGAAQLERRRGTACATRNTKRARSSNLRTARLGEFGLPISQFHCIGCHQPGSTSVKSMTNAARMFWSIVCTGHAFASLTQKQHGLRNRLKQRWSADRHVDLIRATRKPGPRGRPFSLRRVALPYEAGPGRPRSGLPRVARYVFAARPSA